MPFIVNFFFFITSWLLIYAFLATQWTLLIQESRQESTRDIWCAWKSKTRIWIHQETEIVDWNCKAKTRVTRQWKATYSKFKSSFHIWTDSWSSKTKFWRTRWVLSKTNKEFQHGSRNGKTGFGWRGGYSWFKWRDKRLGIWWTWKRLRLNIQPPKKMKLPSRYVSV